MFETLESFSIFFFSVAGLLLAGILFEEKFIALEDKFDKKRSEKRNAIRKQNSKEARRCDSRRAQQAD